MDWPKIKTVLILLLLITNILLALNYWLSRDQFSAEYENAEATMRQLYRAKGIDIRTEIPQVPARLPGIEIAQLTFQRGYIDLVLGIDVIQEDSRFFNDRVAAQVEDTKLAVAEKPFIDPIVFSSRYRFGDPVEVTPEEKEALTAAADSMFRRYFLNFEYQGIEVYDQDDLRIMRLYQRLGGYVNDESVIFVWFREGRAIGFYLENIVSRVGDDTEKYAIIPVNEAMFSALSKLEDKDELIGIELVYKLNDTSLLVENIIQGEALPYFKFIFGRTDPIYVRAVR